MKMLIVMGQTGNRELQSKADSSFSSVHDNETLPERKRLVAALSELRNLLEEYSPAWYTEEQHRRVESALQPRKRH